MDKKNCRFRLYMLSALALILLSLIILRNTDPGFVEFHVVDRNLPGDFENYYRGGQMISGGVRDIYHPDSYVIFFRNNPEAGVIHLNYPPFIYGLFSFFSHIPIHTVKAGWFYFNRILLFVSMALIFFTGPFKKWNFADRAVAILYSMIFALLFTPAQDNLMMGQVNIVLLFFLVLGLLFYLKGNSFVSGVMVGLAASIKLFPLILVLFFIARKDLKGLIGIATGFAALFLLPLWMFGPTLIKSFFLYGSSGYSDWFNFTNPWLQSVPSMLSYWSSLLTSPHNPGGSGILTKPLSIVIAVFVLIATFYNCLKLGKYSGENNYARMLSYNSFITAIFLVSPLVWPYYLVLILPVLGDIFYLQGKNIEGADKSLQQNALLMLLILAVIGMFGGVIPNSSLRLARQLWKLTDFFLSNHLTPLFLGYLWYLQISSFNLALKINAPKS